MQSLIARPNPAPAYAEALARYTALAAQDTPDLNAVCHTQLLTHGHRAQRVAVLWHGFTNCPHQFVALGQALHQRGYNVLLPRLPYHGLRDRLTPKPAHLTATQLVSHADEVIDIAHGLGEHVTVMGISAGGILTSWVAQHRAEVDQALIIAPSFSLRGYAGWRHHLLIHLGLTLPNLFLWWDGKHKADIPPDYGYPRFATRAMCHILALGAAVQKAARHARPAARSVWLVINAADPAVENSIALDLMAAWHANGATGLHTHTFPAELNLIHDIIDPNQAEQRTEMIYPVLFDLLERP